MYFSVPVFLCVCRCNIGVGSLIIIFSLEAKSYEHRDKTRTIYLMYVMKIPTDNRHYIKGTGSL